MVNRVECGECGRELEFWEGEMVGDTKRMHVAPCPGGCKPNRLGGIVFHFSVQEQEGEEGGQE